MALWNAWIVALVAGCGAFAGDAVTTDSLLRELADRSAIARYPDPPFRMLQSSSYDRATKAADAKGWFANNDAGNFLRVDERAGRHESVMLDAAGPGAVVRIWSPNPKGTMRVYVDGAATPVIAAPMNEVLDGTVFFGDPLHASPLAGTRSKGWNLFVPIPFAQRCVITTDDGAGVYYQINWRDYEDDVRVTSFARETSFAFAEIARHTPAAPMRAQSTPVALPPGAQRTVFSATEQGSIDSITVRVADASQFVASRLALIATFDGARTVWAPIVDLAEGSAALRGSVSEGEFTVTWPMPFATSATLELVNFDDAPMNVAVDVRTAPWTWDAHSMHFHAMWHRDSKLRTRPMRDFRFADITGEGVLAGDSLHIVNTVDAWWGEGDEKIYVDGEPFPSHIGTGTEDYYGYGWCSNEPFTHPLHNQRTCEGKQYGSNWGRAIVARLRGLDAIPFTTRLTFDMEVWHWAECDLSYGAVTFLYAKPGARGGIDPDPDEAKLGWTLSPERPKPFVIENAVECESMKVGASSPELPVMTQDMRAWGARTWSGEQQLWIRARRVGDFVELIVPAPGTESVRVTLHATRSWDYGIVQFSVNGKVAGEPRDFDSGSNGAVRATGPIDLGNHTPRAGSLVLRAEVTGGNVRTNARSFFFGLDCVTLTPATLDR